MHGLGNSSHRQVSSMCVVYLNISEYEKGFMDLNSQQFNIDFVGQS